MGGSAGIYCCTYALAIAGAYELMVYLGNTPIRAAPWELLVKEPLPCASMSSLQHITPRHPRIGQRCRILVRANPTPFRDVRARARARSAGRSGVD